VCSAAGRAVLRVVDAEKRQAHCHEVRTTGWLQVSVCGEAPGALPWSQNHRL